MIIAAIDDDRNFTETLGEMLKNSISDVVYRSFSSADDCFRFVEENDVTLVFLNKDIGNDPLGMQIVHHHLRQLSSHIDIILVGSDQRLDSDTAIWSIQNRCSDYLCKPVTYEKLISSLQNIWFNPIPEFTEQLLPTH